VSTTTWWLVPFPARDEQIEKRCAVSAAGEARCE
jgi:hypothetical protein